MKKLNFPVLIGLESIVSDELEALGYATTAITKSNASVSLELEDNIEDLSVAIAKTNIYLRTAERVELELLEFQAKDFDELFARVQEFAWENWIPKDAAFNINGFNRKSNLYADSSIQSTIKKAIVVRLQSAWGLNEESKLTEDSDILELNLRYSLLNNKMNISLDTTGVGLHKRGYRLESNEAPIKETLAAGILDISMYSATSGELLYDPCCGSGTFLIEAAMKAANIQPGSYRSFDYEKWEFLDQEITGKVRQEAIANETAESFDQVLFAGSDIDEESIRISKENAQRAGVANLIDFSVQNLESLNVDELLRKYEQEKILFVANPPYGDRMSDERKVRKLNGALGKLAFYPKSKFTKPNVRLSVITSADFERHTSHRADKRRKLYNGMKKTDLYHYFRAKYV